VQVADQIWLVVSTPLKNMSSSLGIILPNIWQSKNVPNHQPVLVVLLGRMNCMLPALPWIGYCLEVRNCSATDAVADEVADG